MLVSVPLFALVYAIFRTFVTARLTHKKLPIDTKDYETAPESLPKDDKKEEDTTCPSDT